MHRDGRWFGHGKRMKNSSAQESPIMTLRCAGSLYRAVGCTCAATSGEPGRRDYDKSCNGPARISGSG